jgi:hypothetical protein
MTKRDRKRDLLVTFLNNIKRDHRTNFFLIIKPKNKR